MQLPTTQMMPATQVILLPSSTSSPCDDAQLQPTVIQRRSPSPHPLAPDETLERTDPLAASPPENFDWRKVEDEGVVYYVWGDVKMIPGKIVWDPKLPENRRRLELAKAKKDQAKALASVSH